MDRDGTKILPDESIEYRWRGVSMDRYEKGRWFRPRFPTVGFSLGLTEGRIIRQLIKLEPTDSPVLFGLRPMVSLDAPDKHYTPEFNELDGSIFRTDPKGGDDRLLGRLAGKARSTTDRALPVP